MSQRSTYWSIVCRTRRWLQISGVTDWLFTGLQKPPTEEGIAARMWFEKTKQTRIEGSRIEMFKKSNLTPRGREEYMLQAKRLEQVLDLDTFKEFSFQNREDKKARLWDAQIPDESYDLFVSVVTLSAVVTLPWLCYDFDVTLLWPRQVFVVTLLRPCHDFVTTVLWPYYDSGVTLLRFCDVVVVTLLQLCNNFVTTVLKKIVTASAMTDFSAHLTSSFRTLRDQNPSLSS